MVEANIRYLYNLISVRDAALHAVHNVNAAAAAGRDAWAVALEMRASDASLCGAFLSRSFRAAHLHGAIPSGLNPKKKPARTRLTGFSRSSV
jgi:hypothetical protein